ncbi:MAG: Cupin 2 conserved barrel domain protein [Acidobacteria bacterium]|nr:Cupin 2 conserved barrel domain protein [Acidobacteriota bacterium]
MTQPVIRAMDDENAVPVERASGTTIEVLLGAADGAPRFATRRFTIAPGGRIPCHRHDDIEHEQVVLEGRMVLGLDERVVEVGPGDCLLIPPAG